MASHVVVIDASLRRVTIKTTPATHLSNVLDEACSKLTLDPQQYGLKHNNKPVDLSRTIRLSGLSAGAKLNLVQASRSPSIVSVALQLPAEGNSTGTLARLTDKFPSDTPIWQVLRRFEAGAAGSASSPSPRHNFTQRATPLLPTGGTSGSGRLCYEMPVVNIMGRDLGSFVDLQKTLGQLGFNSGSCLLRLSYRNTQQPLEEAMAEISRYFKNAEEPAAPSAAQNDSDQGATRESGTSASVQQGVTDLPVETQESPPSEPTFNASAAGANAAQSTQTGHTTPDPGETARESTSAAVSGISIFAPPSSTTPAAASQADYNEADYIPTVVHAQQHQARLAAESRNKKLLSDAELAAQQESRANALSSVKEVVVRFRFPDQSQAQRSFGQDATTGSLYAFCRELMNKPSGEEFSIRIVGGKAASENLQDSSIKLIQNLGWQGRVLVTVVWADNVSAETRRRPCLKEQYRKQAEALKVDLIQASQKDDAEEKARQAELQKKKSSSGGGKTDVESKMRGFLKGLSKK